MTLTREHAREVLDTYIRAWETQDSELICTIFTESATYHERVLGKPIPGRNAIREYWETKVARDQANIRCTLLTFYLDPDRDAVIAEWEAVFDDVVQGVRKRMRELAVLEFDGELIDSLREYWASEQLGKLESAE
jgi:nuclear transport factor 2 (NTF2) superfamily protein